MTVRILMSTTFPLSVGIICTGISVTNEPFSHIPSYNNFVAVLEPVRTILTVNPTDCSSCNTSMVTMQLQLSHILWHSLVYNGGYANHISSPPTLALTDCAHNL